MSTNQIVTIDVDDIGLLMEQNHREQNNNGPYYAVKVGRNPGVYVNWNDVKSQIDMFTGADVKKFSSKDAAMNYVGTMTFYWNHFVGVWSEKDSKTNDHHVAVVSDDLHMDFTIGNDQVTSASGALMWAMSEYLNEMIEDNQFPDVIFHVNDRYVLNVLNKYIKTWSDRGWTTSTGEVKDRDIVQILWNRIQKFPSVSATLARKSPVLQKAIGAVKKCLHKK